MAKKIIQHDLWAQSGRGIEEYCSETLSGSYNGRSVGNVQRGV